MPNTFPGTLSNPLGIKLELLINGTFQDISAYLYQRNLAQITNQGRADWTSGPQAGQLTLTLNNRDGRFTPKNISGAYYPYLTRNVQIRLSVNTQSVTGAAYSGYLFWGEVTEWPPKWDPASRDVYCDIIAAGIWQRLSQLITTLGSAFRRYYANQTGVAVPRSYWPMEDGTGSTGLIPFASAAGTGPATWAFVTGTAGLSLAASSSFPGSDAIPQLNASAVTFTVPAGGTATNNFTRFLLSVPAAGDSASGSTNWNLIEIDSAGTVAKFEIYLNSAGTLLMQLRNSGGAVIASGTTTTNVRGVPYLASCELAPSGGNVLFALSLIRPGAAAITETISGTLTTATVGAISKIILSRANALMDTAAGHMAVFYGTPPTLVNSAYALSGYTGEYALDRFTRLCTEMGIAFETIGSNAGAYDAAVTADTPAAWLKLADVPGTTTAADSSGNGHTGTATAVTFGIPNSAVNPENSAAFAAASTSHVLTAYNPALAAVTVEALVSLNSLSPSGNPRIMANSQTDVDHKGFQLMLSGTTPQIWFGNGTVAASVTASAALPPAGWVHLAATWDGTTITLYVNGISQGTAALSGSMAAGAANIGIGYDPAYSGDYVSGLIQQCAVYSTALSAARILAHYQAISSSSKMGPQVDDTLANLLLSIEDTDVGLLYELTDNFGLGYRSNASMLNQAAAVVINYNAGILDPSLAPVYDNQLTRNNITITNWTGYSQQAILTAGAMSVLNPPNGIGNGYALARNVTAANDNQVPGIAQALLNIGSVDEIRFPVITVKMIKPSLAPFFASVPGLRPGDYIQLTNLPQHGGSSTAKQLMWGRSVTLGAREWAFSFNTVPETPWETGFSPGTIQTAQIPGGSVVASQAPGAGGLASVIANGSITPAMLNQGITIHTLGGNAITISVSAPSSPNVNDIWIASATGLISQWNGSSWVPFKFDGTAAIQAASITSASIAAGTIVASNIAAGTITAALLAAGIVVAGIVNATTITGATFIVKNASGATLLQLDASKDALFLYADTGSVTQGALLASLGASASTDPLDATSYPQGLFSQQLTLANQASAPPALAGASVFYSSVAGRPRYKGSVGDDSVIERSTVNVSQFTVGNTITPSQISADLSYLGGEANQSSEYEIEIEGAVTWAAVGQSRQTLIFALYADGLNWGGQQTVDFGALVAGDGGHYWVRYLFSCVTMGVSGTFVINTTGILARNTANRIFDASGSGAPLGNQATSVALDTTANHTFEIRAWWGGTATGQTLTTYRTKLGRRM